MFGFLFKQKEKEKVTPRLSCQHKWKDFPLFMETSYDGMKGSYPYILTIKESYVCCICKREKETILAQSSFRNANDRDDAAKAYIKQYPNRFKEIFEVRDEIEDFKNVDREYLSAYEQVVNPKDEIGKQASEILQK